MAKTKAAAAEQNRPRIHNTDGTRVANSGNKETLFIVPGLALYREDWKTFSDKCDTDSIHPLDKIRDLIHGYAPSPL